MGESWDADVTDPATVLNPQINWAREFRYDGARARYLNRPLDPGPLEMLPTASVFDLPGGQSVETIYDGDEPYADRPGSLPWTLFAPGIARVEAYDPFAPPVGSVNTDYHHSDMLGTMRTMSDPTGLSIDMNGTGYAGVDAVYTAFGERIVNTFADGASNRYGYVGAYGYQAHDSAEMPFLHIGARYYDPASGRFLQRDPAGIWAEVNTFIYGHGSPAVAIDPSGLYPLWGYSPPPITPSDLANFFLFLTGGQDSWLDDPAKVKTGQDVLMIPAFVCVVVLAPGGAAGKIIAGTAVGIAKVING